MFDGRFLFAQVGVEIVDAASVFDVALGIEDEGLRCEGRVEVLSELAGGVEEDGELDLVFLDVLSGGSAGEGGIGDDGKEAHGVAVIFMKIGGEAVEFGDVFVGDGALGGDEDQGGGFDAGGVGEGVDGAVDGHGFEGGGWGGGRL